MHLLERRTRRLAGLALAMALALLTQLAAAPQPAVAAESELGGQLQEILEQAQTDVAGAIDSLQEVLTDIPGGVARGFSNVLAGLDAFDSGFFQAIGTFLITLIVMALIALIGVPICEMLPFCTVF